MITDFFITFGLFILDFIISLFPISTGFPTDVTNSVNYLGGIVGIFSPLVPLGTLATVLTLYVSIDLIIFSFKTFKWLFSFIPFIGGKG